MTESLIHLIYTSAATSEPTLDEMGALLHVSRRNNERVGISGMLLHSEGTFFQVLEGPQLAVERTLAAIAADSRHCHVVTIIRERIAQRAFPNWTMGYVTAPSAEVAVAAGMNDFFGQGSCFDRLDGGRAKKLLTAFRNGRWRVQRQDGGSLTAMRRTG